MSPPPPRDYPPTPPPVGGGVDRRLASLRYQAWLDLVDLSTELALAGLKARGYSTRRAMEIFRRRWGQAHQEHLSANRKIIRRLALRDASVS